MGAKKNNLLLILLFCSNTVCHAQFQIGIRQGISVGKAQLEGEKENKLVASLRIGLAMEYGFSKTFAVELECLYATKKTRNRWDYTRDESGTHSVQMNCIEVPVLLKVYLLNRVSKIFVDAGASVSYALSIKEFDEWRHNGPDHSNSEKVSIHQSPVENPGYAINGGFGYLAGKGRFVWGAGLRYIHSLNHDVYALYTNEYTKEKTRYKGKDRQVRTYFMIAYVFKPDK